MVEPIPAHGELTTVVFFTDVLLDQRPTAPMFISSRSADVILSDIRPTKLTPDALNSINALLDELLYIILNAARAFNPSNLRTAMHKVLPTTLGKEAILEAEMELRAYYQRTDVTAGSGSSGEDGLLNVQWAYEVRITPMCHFTQSSFLHAALTTQMRSVFDFERHGREFRCRNSPQGTHECRWRTSSEAGYPCASLALSDRHHRVSHYPLLFTFIVLTSICQVRMRVSLDSLSKVAVPDFELFS